MEFWQLQKKSIALLDRQSRQKYTLAIFLQSSLGLLDLMGVLLTGIIGTLASVIFTKIELPKPIESTLEFLHLSQQDPANVMIVLSLVALGFFLVKTALALVFSRKTFRFLSQQQSQISSQLVSKVLNSEYIWLRKQDPHTLSSAMIQGVSAATVNSLGQILLLTAEITLVFLFLLVLIIVNPAIAIFTILYLALVLWALNFFVGEKIARFNRNLTQLRVESQVNLFNSLKLFREIRVMRRTPWFEKNIDKIFTEQSKNFSDDIWIQQIPKYALEVALLLGATGLLLAGRLLTDSHQIIPILAIYMAGAARIFPSLLRIQSSIFSLRSHSYLAKSALDLLNTLELNHSVVRPKEGMHLEMSKVLTPTHVDPEFSIDTSISLTGVEFSYPNSDSEVLRGVTFRIEPGERVAIVGPSGAGKSTLCDIFLGLLQPTSGDVQIGANPAAKWIERNVGKISYLPQEITMVTGTFLENICLGVSPDEVDHKRVALAIRRAQLEDFLEQLPDGLSTNFGVSGVELSGGQKQRIGIARALYSDPKIIIMDEATSALDAETEHAIINILAGLDFDTTLIFIAHRLSSIRNFARIMYFEEGILKEDGNFDYVKSKVPRFAKQVSLFGL